MTDFAALPANVRLAMTLQEAAHRKTRRRFFDMYPDTGPLRRELYKKHLLFFRLGKHVQTRAAIAANRIGKTVGCGGYELVCHLTGKYPAWWDGHRFDHPIDAWAAGDTKETVRDILQAKLFGPPEALGTGLIPAEFLGNPTWRAGQAKSIDTAAIKHVSGRWSHLGMKSYDQGRTSFQGTEKHVILLDEEAPLDVRSECVIRLMTTAGLLIETFTPLQGITEVVQMYMGEGAQNDDNAGVTMRDGRAMVMIGWDDVPHLSQAEKERMIRETPPYLRDARSKGIPSLGSGAIYPIPESDIVVDPFRVPAHWPAAYALDVGWNRTAALWGAHDRDNDVIYLVSEHYRGQAEPVIHATAIKARGDWIPGVIDPAARGRGVAQGEQMLKMYRDLGLDLVEADNSVEAGIYEVWGRLSTGRLKVFRTLSNWLAEYRVYRRNDKGKIVKENDHLMDDTRYLLLSGMKRAKVRAVGMERPAVRTEILDAQMGW